MSKRSKLTILIGAVAAIISSVVLVIVFWDKLAALCPCSKKAFDAEMSDYADLDEV